MSIYVDVISQEEWRDLNSYLIKEVRFQLDQDEPIFLHMGNVYDEFAQMTNRIIVAEDIAKGEDLLVLHELLMKERSGLEKLHVEGWTFNPYPKYEKTIEGRAYRNQEEFDSMKAFCAEHDLKNFRYEVSKVNIGKFEVKVKKEWHEVKKNDIIKHINDFMGIIENAIENDSILRFSPW